MLRLFILWGLIINCECEFFSSTESLRSLVIHETIVLEEMEIFISNLQKAVDFLRRKHELVKLENEEAQKDLNSYINNPLNAFLMIKRTTTDIEQIPRHLVNVFKNFSESIDQILPTNDDLSGAAEGLFRLQKTYNLRSKDLAQGIIDGKKTRNNLTSHDLFTIASLAEDIYLEQEYLKLALESFQSDNISNPNDIDESNVIVELADSYKRSGNYQNALKIITDLSAKFPEEKKYQKLVQSYKEYSKQNYSSEKQIEDPFFEEYALNGQYSVKKEDILFRRACRGKVQKNPEELKELHCRYISNSFFSKIAPFKAQEINRDPDVFLFYGVMSDEEIEHIKNITLAKLGRAEVIEPMQKVTSARTSQIKFITQRDRVVDRIKRRVGDMTGLNMISAESLQVQNYGIGGHYKAHFDFIPQSHKSIPLVGNRIATMLFYMSDVEKGGATVFPYLKIFVSPVKGNAVFWYNLKRSGERYTATKHAGCSVLLGSKIVSNQWLHEHNQEFIRPCLPENFVETDVNEYQKGFM